MKDRSSTPPLHVHVDENTPVHVHIKKLPKPSAASSQKSHKRGMKGDTVNVRRSVRVKTKNPPHCLEITPPSSEKLVSVMRLSDLSTEDDDSGHCKMNRYDKKIDSLMNAVGCLKSEVKMQKGERQMAKRFLEERKEELEEVAHELAETEHENTVLRHNIERIKEEKDFTMLQKKHLQQEKECLMSKLVEAEMDGAAAAKQVMALKDTIGKLKTEKQMTCTDINTLTRQKELLLQKLSTFEETNRTLRDLLREQHCKEKDSERLMEQQGTLLKRLAEADSEKARLLLLLQDKDKEVEELLQEIQCEKAQAKTASELSKSMESMRGHLQAQLRCKEAENSRLCMQIKNLERSGNQHKAEVEAIMEQLKELKQKGDRDKETLKKAIRAQKERAEKSEEYAEQLHVQLADKDLYVAEALSTLESWRSRYNQVVKDKGDLELEIIVLNDRVTDLVNQQQSLEEKMREDRDSLVERLHRQTAEYSAFKLENERLKASFAPMEDKLNQAHLEVQQLKASVKNYEGMIDNYKSQVMKTRLEADEVAAQLERCDKENKMLKDEMNKEIEAARRQFQSQLADLQQLPDILKITEAKLAECQDQLQGYERKNIDLTAIISDLRSRIEHQGDKLEMAREKHQASQKENKQLSQKVDELERKLEATSAQNVEFLQVIAKREEAIHQAQLRLEEKTRECGSLARQLESAIEDARRQVEQTKEQALSKERAAQSKILDLETQLSRTKTELGQLRRTRDDADRRYQSRLQDLKDRLEQSESTNRSMQNYVQFLKASYANVFGDAPYTSSYLTSSPIRSRSPPA
ncbi:outer dense fiber protein 2 isoform X12 [Mus musculus]|uniref:Outer dense fiber protein 2 n=1 Tax=Mus caroli TaxID=10089 RepID=A0A6P7QU92_MUSCR|nr:outer dense fiber protein 2 isoform X12 [Mus musculus]XP_017171790.1 outer dense fiber protein 2 isoform X12 [Mus musculus]XP_029329191.1 outer dense fiber protein 2 isoform X12 [Mus caroli]XP_036015330.1 outer dense fiber protein 2 isoform X12 [Mus musculus]|eukprot:XP_017171789.1 PREDICTED: outer dense fiber protein 2 isoform X13 [Mus musculus]